MYSVGNIIKELRAKNKLSQFELAKLLSVSIKTISNWENNRTLPDKNYILKLADIFKNDFYSLNYNNLDNKELEIKLKVDLDEWNRVLKVIKKNSKYIGEEKHCATYYCQNLNNSKNEWLRIREENGKYILNYKKKIEKHCCNEYETLIGDAKSLENILTCLNFKKIGKIDKIRKKYLYNEKYEISFDNVKNIGLFIEIEIKKFDSNYSEEYDKLIKLLTELKINLNFIINKRYPEYLIVEN